MQKTKFYLPQIILASCLVLMIWALGETRNIFLISFFVAYLLRPLLTKLQSLGLSRNTSIGLLVFTTFGPFVVFVILSLPYLLSQLSDFLQLLPEKAKTALLQIQSLAAHFGFKIPVEQEALEKFILQHTKSISFDLVTQATQFVAQSALSATQLLISLLSLALAPVVFIYVLADFELISRAFIQLVPLQLRPRFRQVIISADQMFGSYLKGQTIASSVLSLYYGLALWICGLPYGFLIGVITGFLSFIPYVGYSIGCLLVVVMFLATGGTWLLAFALLVAMLFGQFLESFVVVPKLVGHHVGLTALEALLALIICGHLFGFLGLLLALPIGGLFKKTAQEFV